RDGAAGGLGSGLEAQVHLGDRGRSLLQAGGVGLGAAGGILRGLGDLVRAGPDRRGALHHRADQPAQCAERGVEVGLQCGIARGKALADLGGEVAAGETREAGAEMTDRDRLRLGLAGPLGGIVAEDQHRLGHAADAIPIV
ncbi:hypothetical protein QU38_01115, partial [Staphylococcus aureus]